FMPGSSCLKTGARPPLLTPPSNAVLPLQQEKTSWWAARTAPRAMCALLLASPGTATSYSAGWKLFRRCSRNRTSSLQHPPDPSVLVIKRSKEIERPVTLAEARRGADRLMHEVSRRFHRHAKINTLRQQPGNGRGKRAARAMRVARINAGR